MNGLCSMPGSAAEAQGKVQAIACHIDAIIIDQKAQVDEWVLGPELVQVLEQPSIGESAVAPDCNDLLDLAVLQPIKSRTDPFKSLREHRPERQPFVRQGKPPGQSAEEGDAQHLLKAFHLMADCCLRHTQFKSGPGEAEVPGRGFERPQGVEREMRLSHAEGQIFLMALSRITRLREAG